MKFETLEESIAQFERELFAGSNPDVLDFADPSDSDQLELFVELLHTELEIQLRSGKNIRVEDITNRFPAIANDEQMVAHLIETEFKVRSKFEPGLRIQEYADRFPSLYQSLALESAIDHTTVATTTDQSSIQFNIQPSCSDFSSRFRKIKLHKQGGLGNIWLAKDNELDREVVIKEIKEKFSRSPAHRARFEREQAITSMLHHPGIVPILGHGHFADGTPYFAMQFIDGLTLTDAVEQFHKNSNLNELDRQLDFRRLLEHFIDACNTIEYGHSQGIIHRDIKPANIMIGRFGETFVVDWGLAKTEKQIDEAFDQDNHQPAKTSHDNTDTFSIAGQSIGSPGYMSPEQRNGKIADMNALTDIYGLGATLWKIVTGSHPPSAQDKSTDLDSTDPGMIQPLISVATKAMSAAPHDRYASADALSKDVQRYLSDEPVQAHKYSFLQRIGRFTRKHNEFVSAASIAGLLLTLLLAAAAVWINHERQSAVVAKESESLALRQSEDARKAEALSRKQAENRTSQLTSTIQLFADLFAGADDGELYLPTQTTTLEEALEKLRGQADSYDSPIQSMLFAIFARSMRGRGDFIEATEQYENSLKLLRQDNIPKTDPLFQDVLIGLAFCHLHLGNRADAVRLKTEIRSVLNGQIDDKTLQHFKFKMLEARLAQEIHNATERAIDRTYEAINIAHKLYPGQPDHKNLLWANYRLASLHRSAGRNKDAVPIFQEIIAAFESQFLQHTLAISSAVQLAVIDYENGEIQLAIEKIESAWQQSSKLMGFEHPDTVTIYSRLATLLTMHPDSEMQRQGIQKLKECRSIQMNHFGLLHPFTLMTNCMLAKAYLAQTDQESIEQAQLITTEYFDPDNPAIIQAYKTNQTLGVQTTKNYIDSLRKQKKSDVALKTLQAIASNNKNTFLKSFIDELNQELADKK